MLTISNVPFDLNDGFWGTSPSPVTTNAGEDFVEDFPDLFEVLTVDTDWLGPSAAVETQAPITAKNLASNTTGDVCSEPAKLT